jgi:DtxR family Mn-dependent transcriptional regulator
MLAGARVPLPVNAGGALSNHSDLIDTTEMYLRTVWELEEEGIVPLRARIAERLRQSGPTVSQTVARMERDGYLTVEGDRHLQLTDAGRHRAIAVMRKHRLAECLLVDVIQMPWEDVHIEACRWEHVMSEAVEQRIFRLLHEPTVCPHGNPIPGLDELGGGLAVDDVSGLTTMKDAATGESTEVVVRRISEQLQPDADMMRRLREAGVQPGRSVSLQPFTGGVSIRWDGRSTGVEDLVAEHIFVTPV